MKIAQLSKQGKREHNEDAFLAMESRAVFMVCDGVGGSAKGEVASRLCCNTIGDFLASTPGAVSAAGIQQAIIQAEAAFDNYFLSHPEATGMATTLAFLAIDGSQALIAHAGDSRVYHIRNGEITFVTTDHSLVNEMVASGFITAAEAASHPKKNQITQAIQGNGIPAAAEIHLISGIKPGDYFLLCSDGILEAVNNDFIKEQFSAGSNPVDITAKIDEVCSLHSNDNYTCLVIQTEQVAEKVFAPVLPAVSPAKKTGIRVAKNKGLFIVLILMLSALALFFIMNKRSNKPIGVSPEEITTDTGTVVTTSPAKQTLKQEPAVSKEKKEKDTGQKKIKDKPKETIKENEDPGPVIPERVKNENEAKEKDAAPAVPDDNKNKSTAVVSGESKEEAPLTADDIRRIKVIIADKRYEGCDNDIRELHKKINNAPAAQKNMPYIKEFEKKYSINCTKTI